MGRASVLLWSGCVLVGGWAGSAPDKAQLAFLSVGQGDCAVFQSGGTAVLIDAGPRYGSYDAGARAVIPKLRQLGIGHIDAIFVTHPDMDHIGGLASVARRFPAARIVASAAFRSHPALLDVLRQASVDIDRVIWLEGSSDLRIGGFSLDVSAPPVPPGEEDNAGSLFIRLSDGGSSAVLSGDSPADTEIRMLPIEDWRAQIVKAGHHGSRTSTGDPWLREVKPQLAVISCGRANQFGHPHREVLSRLKAHGVQTLRTDHDGDLVFTATPRGFKRMVR